MSEANFQEPQHAKHSKNKTHKKKIIIVGSILILAVISFFSIWYFSSDHSVYSKLSVAKYNKNNINVSFSYPSVMKLNTALISKLSQYNTPLVYNYSISKKENLSIAFRYQSIGPTMSLLKLTPSTLLNQIRIKSGNYIDFIDGKKPSSYSSLYGSCTNYITNIHNQTSLICGSDASGVTTTEVIGIDYNYQYSLYLVMPTAVWNSHQQVWQNVEKSFTY